MFNFSANHLTLLSRREYRSCATYPNDLTRLRRQPDDFPFRIQRLQTWTPSEASVI